MAKGNRSRPAREDGDRHRPFRDLARLLRAAGVQLETEKKAPCPVRKELPPETTEEDLFSTAMKGVVRAPWYCDNAELVLPEIRRFEDSDSEDLRLLQAAMEGLPPAEIMDHPEYIEGWVDITGKAFLPKLRTGTYSIEAQLDLHGFGLSDARAAVESFIAQKSRARSCCVKIIHGRGINSSRDRAVLKEHLQRWLTTRRMSRHVVAYASAQARDGGVGAIYVLVRRFLGTGRASRPGARKVANS